MMATAAVAGLVSGVNQLLQGFGSTCHGLIRSPIHSSYTLVVFEAVQVF